jgi:hypothetical protein
MFKLELQQDEVSILKEALFIAELKLKQHIENLELLSPKNQELDQARMNLIDSYRIKLIQIEAMKNKLYSL